MTTEHFEQSALKKAREAGGLRTYLTDVDSAAVGAIADRFGAFVSADRLKMLPDLPCNFESDREFRESYCVETGQKAPEGLTGFTHPDSRAHVSLRNLENAPEVVLHERLHQLASPEARRLLGDQLYEGVTQDLAIELLGREPQVGDLTGYPEERQRAHNLRSLLGAEAICRAYFQGDVNDLRTAIDQTMAGRSLISVEEKVKDRPPLT